MYQEMEYQEIVYQEIMYLYRNGEKERAIEKMIQYLNSYIYKLQYERFRTYLQYRDDFYQSAVLAVVEVIDKYNEQKSTPSTFFSRYMLHEMCRVIYETADHMSSYYCHNIKSINEAINKLECEGRSFTLSDIAKETGLSEQSVRKAKEIETMSKEVYYDKDKAVLDCACPACFASSEEVVMKSETRRILEGAIQDLPAEETRVIKLRCGFVGEKPMSYRKISKEMNQSIGKVRKWYQTGIEKLRNNDDIKDLF